MNPATLEFLISVYSVVVVVVVDNVNVCDGKFFFLGFQKQELLTIP